MVPKVFEPLKFDCIFFLVGERQQRFFSQDIERYFWWFECFNGTVDTFRSCDYGFFDLQIPSINTTSELDISGVPWGQVAEDLMEFTGLKFRDSMVRFTWFGTGSCKYSFYWGSCLSSAI